MVNDDPIRAAPSPLTVTMLPVAAEIEFLSPVTVPTDNPVVVESDMFVPLTMLPFPLTLTLAPDWVPMTFPSPLTVRVALLPAVVRLLSPVSVNEIGRASCRDRV